MKKQTIKPVGYFLIALIMGVYFLTIPVFAEKERVYFVSPQNDDLWVGIQMIEIKLENVKAEMLQVVSVYLDGRLIKEFSNPPYKFNYDFGQSPKNRKLEVMVALKNASPIRKEIFSYHLDDAQEVDVLQVVLPVAVTDGSGNYVSTLKQDDFIILEDGVPQQISYFSTSGKANFHLVLLIDISSSMKDKIQNVKSVAKNFLRELMGKEDKAIIVFFNQEVFEDNEFTNNLSELENAISVAFPFGATALYDAVAYSIKILKGNIGHNIIILLSDGEDNSSSIDPYTLIKMVQRSNAVIYSIGKKNYMEGSDQYQDLLKKISSTSGGITFLLDDMEQIQKVYQEIRKDIKAQYLIRFSPKDKTKRNRFREITVKLKKKRGYSVRTMKGYTY